MALPKTIKLGDTEYTLADHPELTSLVEEVRKEEKNKLYSEKTKLEKKIEELNEKATAAEGLSKTEKVELDKAKADLTKKEADLVEANKNLEAAKAANKKATEGDDKPLTKKELAEAVAAIVNPMKEEYEKKLKELGGEVEGKIVSDYKAKLLEDNKGQIIPEMLTGNTVAELNESLKKAKEVSKSYLTTEVTAKDGKKSTVTLVEAERLKAEETAAVEELKNRGTGATAAAAPDKKAGADGSGDISLKDVKDMSAEEYKEHRKEIMKKAQTVKYGEE
jgi:hypothetical protein